VKFLIIKKFERKQKGCSAWLSVERWLASQIAKTVRKMLTIFQLLTFEDEFRKKEIPNE